MNEAPSTGRKFTVSVSSPGPCRRVLAIEVPEETLADERERVARELRRDLRVPGFRRGRVPMDFVRKNYAGVIRSEAVRNLLPAVYEEAIEREGIVPLGDPRFENLRTEEGEGLQVEAHVEVRPEVGEITGIDTVVVEAPPVRVTDADVDEVIERFRERMAAYEPVEREAAGTDVLVIDYAPYAEDGSLDEEAGRKGHPVDLSSGTLLEEFRVGLVGMKPGDEKDIEVRYPDDFPDEALRGGTRRFHVRVNEVREKMLPELDDAFAKRLDEKIESLEALRARIREDLERDARRRREHDIREKIVDRLLEKNPIDVPEIMVHNYIHSLLEEDRRRRPDVPDEAAREKEMHELFRPAAERAVRRFFLLDAVRRQAGIEVTEEDVQRRVDELAESTGQPAETIRAHLASPDNRRRLENELLDEKVLNYLYEKAEIVEE